MLLPEIFDPSQIPQTITPVDRPWSKKTIVLHAISYAERGWFVFPSPQNGEKKGCVSAESSNGNRWGCTDDLEQVTAYYRQFPNANVGIATGTNSQIFVLEADTSKGHAHDGIASLRALEAQHGELPQTLMAESPTGSLHYYFNYPNSGAVNSASKIALGVDVRGEGGMVIAPPSVRPGKGCYTWLNSLPVAEAPDWLKAAVGKAEPPAPSTIAFTVPAEPVSDVRLAAYGETALSELMAELAATPSGQKNTEANRIAFRAGQLVGGGCLNFGDAYHALEQTALSWGINPRDKALGPKGTIARGLKAGEKKPRGPDDNVAPSVKILLEVGERIDPETGEITTAPPVLLAAEDDFPDAFLDAPGLVNDIANWTMATAMFPCRLFAVAGALAAIGATVGRQVYTGVPRTGTALYWLAVAPTASGKDRPQEAIKQIMEGAGLAHIVKSSVSSSAKLGVSLQEKPLQIQIIDEVGKVLRKFVGRNASTQEMALLDDYCTVWGKNLGSFSPEGVTTRGDIVIKRPSLMLFGATTPTNFYSQLRNNQVAGGFLNRFIVLHRFERVLENRNPLPEELVPPGLIEAIRTLHTFQDGIQRQSAVATFADHTPPLFVVPAETAAEKLLTDYRAKAREMVLKSDHDPIFEIWARAGEMVKRVSLILACARHWQDMKRCEVQLGDVLFSGRLIDWSMNTFMEGMRNHVSENEYQANSKMILNLIREAGSGGIAKNHLCRRIDGKLSGRDIQAIVGSLEDAGSIKIVGIKPTQKGGRPKITYTYTRGQK